MRIGLRRPATSLQIDLGHFGGPPQGDYGGRSLVPRHAEHSNPMACRGLGAIQHQSHVDFYREMGEQGRIATDVSFEPVVDAELPSPFPARSRAQSFADGSPTARQLGQPLRSRLETFDPFEMPSMLEPAVQSDYTGLGLPPGHASGEHLGNPCGELSDLQTQPQVDEYQMMYHEQPWPQGAFFKYAEYQQPRLQPDYFHEARGPQLEDEHVEAVERFEPQLPVVYPPRTECLQLQPQHTADWVHASDRPQSRLHIADYKTMDPMDLAIGSSIMDLSQEQRGQPRNSVGIAATEPMESRLQTCQFKSFDPFEDQSIDLSWPATEDVKQSIQELLRKSVQKKFSPFEAYSQPIVQPSSAVSQNSAQIVNKLSLEVHSGVELAEDSDDQNTPIPHNPGSAGHPELCSRICIYFPLGTCENGDKCGYCHCSHANLRKANLDKGSREHLQSLHYLEAYQIMLPVLKKKVQMLRLGPEFLAGLAMPSHAPAIDVQDPERKRNSRRLSAALAKMGLRALLSHLKKIMPEGTPERVGAEMLLQRINGHCHALIQ